jgi:hypothetical protein
VKIVFRIQDKLLSESTRGKKGLALARFFLFFELFLELGVRLLKVAEIVLEEPRFSHPLQLQLVEISLKIYVLLLLLPYALFFCLEFPVATHDCFQLFGFLLGEFGHILHRGKTKSGNSTTYNGRGVIMPYQGKFVHLLGDLLEVSYVVVRQERIIH